MVLFIFLLVTGFVAAAAIIDPKFLIQQQNRYRPEPLSHAGQLNNRGIGVDSGSMFSQQGIRNGGFDLLNPSGSNRAWKDLTALRDGVNAGWMDMGAGMGTSDLGMITGQANGNNAWLENLPSRSGQRTRGGSREGQMTAQIDQNNWPQDATLIGNGIPNDVGNSQNGFSGINRGGQAGGANDIVGSRAVDSQAIVGTDLVGGNQLLNQQQALDPFDARMPVIYVVQLPYPQKEGRSIGRNTVEGNQQPDLGSINGLDMPNFGNQIVSSQNENIRLARGPGANELGISGQANMIDSIGQQGFVGDRQVKNQLLHRSKEMQLRDLFDRLMSTPNELGVSGQANMIDNIGQQSFVGDRQVNNQLLHRSKEMQLRDLFDRLMSIPNELGVSRQPNVMENIGQQGFVGERQINNQLLHRSMEMQLRDRFERLMSALGSGVNGPHIETGRQDFGHAGASNFWVNDRHVGNGALMPRDFQGPEIGTGGEVFPINEVLGGPLGRNVIEQQFVDVRVAGEPNLLREGLPMEPYQSADLGLDSPRPIEVNLSEKGSRPRIYGKQRQYERKPFSYGRKSYGKNDFTRRKISYRKPYGKSYNQIYRKGGY